MSFLTDAVVAAVIKTPGLDMDDLVPAFPNHTRQQIKQALWNAAFRGRVRCERQGVKGFQMGAKPGRYYPADMVPKPATVRPRQLPPNSIFQLGDRALGAQP